MSTAARNPVEIPKGIEVKLNQQMLSIKGAKGMLELEIDSSLAVEISDKISLSYVKGLYERELNPALMGSVRANIRNMIQGVSKGYEKKLELVGVGYRAQAKGQSLSLTLGFSHPVEYHLPKSVTVETPSQTEIVLKSIDKQALGQAAAEIRSYRSPEPYKGKGVRYAGEKIKMKEGKKK